MSPAPADDDDGFDVAGVLADVVALALTDVVALALTDVVALALTDVVALALTDDDPLFLGLAGDVDDDLADGEEEDAEEEAEDDAEEVAVDAATCVAAGVVQVGFGVAPTPFLPSPAELVLVLVLVLWVRLAGGVVVAVDVLLGVTLGLTLGLVLGLTEGLGLGLVMLPLLWLPLDDVGGAVVVWVAPLNGLVLVCAAAGCVDDGAQGGSVTYDATPVALVDPVPSAPGEGCGLLPLPSAAPGPLEEDVVMSRAEPMALTIVAIPWRAGGTAARTTPTANTATPAAKAGRSIASRQSLGRRGSLGCCGSRRAPPRPGAPTRERSGRSPPARTTRRSRSASCRARSPRRRNRAVTTPETASQTPSAPLGRLAWAGRERILSRIRCRPSAPGST